MHKLYPLIGTLVFLAASGTAAVLTVYGTGSGAATVDGPVLYAAEGNDLRVNQAPETVQEYVLDGSGLFLDTDQVDEPDFYPLTANMYATARLNTTGEEELQLEFGFINATDDYALCQEQIQIQSDTHQTYDASCNASVQPVNVQHFYYLFEEENRKQNVSYRVLANGTTRIEVDAR